MAAIVFVRAQADWPFQKRNLGTAQIGLITGMLLLLWWTFFSRAPKRLRLGVTYGLVGAIILFVALFRLRGMTGDMSPILEFRWSNHGLPVTVQFHSASAVQRFDLSTNAGFPQFLGRNRNGVLPGPRLETNWTVHPPQVVWRHSTGAAWSGFSIVGDVALTQEQRGEDECVVACDLASGRQLWLHADKAHYHTTIAGEGP